jgi:hypothetical protein
MATKMTMGINQCGIVTTTTGWDICITSPHQFLEIASFLSTLT